MQKAKPVPAHLKSSPVLDAPRGAALRDVAMQLVEEANDAWVADAVKVALVLAETTEEFTTDQVWERLGGVPVGVEPRAMGPVMRRLESAGIVARTGRHRMSAMPDCHRRPKMIWASLVI